MNGFTRGLRVALIAAVLWALVWGGTALAGVNWGNPFTSSDKSAEAGDDVTLTTATKQALTVNPEDLLPAAAQCHDSGFSWNSVSGKMRWSDSVSTPFASSDKSGMLKEVFTEDCTNPTVLDMNVQALSRVTIDGWNVGDHNPWMSKFLDKASSPGLRTAFLTKKDGVEGIYVTADMQRTAAMTNTLLTRFMNVGVVTEPSVTNWHKPGGGLQAGELVRTVLNPKQENLPVLRLELTEKGQGCVYAIGFNTGDKRFETLSCNQPTPKKPHVTTPSHPGKPGKPGHPGKPHKPGKPSKNCHQTGTCPKPNCHTSGTCPKPNCHTTGTCPKPNCHQTGTCPKPQCIEIPNNGTMECESKDPSKDPAAQGNAPEGGGKNEDPGPGKPNPQPTFPSSPHTNPPAPKPSSTPRPDPVQPPATGAPDPTQAPTTCVPPPGKKSC